MGRKLALFFLFILNVTARAQNLELNKIQDFFQALKNLEYGSAKKIASQVRDGPTRLEMLQLSQILNLAGQEKIVFSEDRNSTNDRVVGLLYNLSKGFYHLYTNPYTELSFSHINSAYTIAKEIEIKEIEKFCILSILEVYSFEVFQSNEDVLEFVNRYKNLVADKADDFQYRLSLATFHLRNVFFEVRIDENFFLSFDTLMQSFTKNHKFWPKYYSKKGVFYESIGELEKARQLHLDAIHLIGEELFLRHIKFRSYIHLGEIARRQSEFSQAVNFVKSASQYGNLADTTRASYYVNLYLSKTYYEWQHYQEAYEHLSAAENLKVRLDYEKNTLEIANLNRLYQTQEKELALLKEREKVQATQNWLIAAGFFLVFISTVYVLVQKNTRRKQLLAMKEKDIQQQMVAHLLKEQELVAIDAMIAGQEKERQRIASDLHDDLGSLMAAIKMHFDTLKNHKIKDGVDLYTKTDSLIDEAYTKVRTIAHAKNSGVIAKEGLLKSVSEMARKVSIDNDLKIFVHDHGLSNRLENSLELSLFRIIQELLTNIIKHSNAKKADIYLTNYGDLLNIMVEDNGQGFNIDNVNRTSDGMGMKSVKKRIEFLGGSVQIDSELGKGTTVVIDIPVD